MEAATPSLLCALTALGLRLADGRFTVAGAINPWNLWLMRLVHGTFLEETTFFYCKNK
jgi:hypothetical protein